MRRAFKYRLYPNKRQARLLSQQFEERRWLYNHLLAERNATWENQQESLRLYDQQATLPSLKSARPLLAQVKAQAPRIVAVRVDLAFQAVFRRCKAGDKPGYPRFRGVGRYDSITYLQAPSGCKLDDVARRVRLHGVGVVKILLHRPLEGAPKTATVTRSSTGKRYSCFSCECPKSSPLPKTGRPVGIDVGRRSFATLSTGQAIDNPRFFRREEHALATAQRRLSKEEKDTPEHTRRRTVVACVYERITWRRGDCTHQHSRRIVNAFDLIAVEDLSINQMTRHCLAKRIHDAAWWQFADLLSYKAAWAGRKYAAVNPANTTQDCSQRGHRQALTLSHRRYTCLCCGIVLDRDLNASVNMVSVGQHALASA
jgi:putative transposase